MKYYPYFADRLVKCNDRIIICNSFFEMKEKVVKYPDALLLIDSVKLSSIDLKTLSSFENPTILTKLTMRPLNVEGFNFTDFNFDTEFNFNMIAALEYRQKPLFYNMVEK